MAAACAPLIEQKDVIAIRVEQRAVEMLRAGARAAVKEHARTSVSPAHFFNVDPVPVARGNHAGIERAQMIARVVVGNHSPCTLG